MRITVPIDPPTFDRLVDLAVSEGRRPRDQAAVLITRALGNAPNQEAEEVRDEPARV